MLEQRNTKTDRLVTYFLGGYAFMGLLVGTSYWWFGEADSSLILYFLAYAFMPLTLVMLRVKNTPYADWLTYGYLALLMIRYVGPDAYWSWYPPITISLPVTNFASGTGFLIDLLPLSLMLLLYWQKEGS